MKVQVKAAGVCGSDLHVLKGECTVPLPTILGHEAAGIVTEVGPGVRGLVPGDHVVLVWHQACGHCRECVREKPWACRHAKSDESLQPDGTTRWHDDAGADVYAYLYVGAMSELVVVPESAAIKIDPRVLFDIASLIGCSVGTAVGVVMNNAQVQAGESAVVVGAGGVGQSLIAALALVGAYPIIAVDVNEKNCNKPPGPEPPIRSNPGQAAQILPHKFRSLQTVARMRLLR